ncbi:MAG: hypothetical protein OQL06_12545 [Gammaproteobacteria bacterium]|nr:hypothetical protein [Gammaproteobacteria bacterium]
MSKFFTMNEFIKLCLRVCVSSFLVLFAVSVTAGRIVNSLPHEEKFDADNYSDIVWAEGFKGATHTWVPNGGWNGNGAAKFTPPVSDQGYSGLGQFNNLNGTTGVNQLNVRFLIYHGDTWQEGASNSKVLIVNRFFDDGSQGDRPMIISHQYNTIGDWVSYGACDGTVCNYQGGGWWPDGTDEFRLGNDPLHREEEWISVELESNAATGLINLYIYTQDGELSGLYTQQTMARPGGLFKYLDILGGYMDPATSAADANTYFMIDELKIDSQYIGPPPGFTVVSKAPTSLIAQ